MELDAPLHVINTLSLSKYDFHFFMTFIFIHLTESPNFCCCTYMYIFILKPSFSFCVHNLRFFIHTLSSLSMSIRNWFCKCLSWGTGNVSISEWYLDTVENAYKTIKLLQIGYQIVKFCLSLHISISHHAWALWWQGGYRRLRTSRCPCLSRLGTLKTPSCPWHWVPDRSNFGKLDNCPVTI